MSEIREEEEVVERDISRSRLSHSWPRDPRYRLSGQIPPTIGDIALCGKVKQTDGSVFKRMPVNCVVCIELGKNPI